MFNTYLDRAVDIVGGKFTQGVGEGGFDAVNDLARDMPLDVAHAWLATFTQRLLGDLPKNTPGVYVAEADNGLAYVGVASNLYSRWWSHSLFMPGHLSPESKSRSRLVLDAWSSDLTRAVVLVREHDVKDYERLASEEVLTYAALVRTRGEFDVSWFDRRTVNSPAMLGSAKRADALPIVGLHVASGTYGYAESQQEMGRVSGVHVGNVSRIVNGKQSSSLGWTFRFATESEIAAANERVSIFGFDGLDPVSAADVVAKHGGKHAVRWLSGALPEHARVVLVGARKRADSPQSGVPGVSWYAPTSAWQAIANKVVDGRRKGTQRLGLFDTVEEAHAALVAAVEASDGSLSLPTKSYAPRSARKIEGTWGLT